MKKTRFNTLPIKYFIMTATILTGCQSRCSDDIVCQEFVHRYGVPLNSSEWALRGKDGLVVSTRKDGVKLMQCYNNGCLDGETSETFPHSDVIANKYVYNLGALSESMQYYKSGLPYTKKIYTADGYTVTAWYESGLPMFEETYIEGLLAQGQYQNHDQKIVSQVVDYNGIKTVYDELGQLLWTADIENGQTVCQKTFYSGGHPQSITPFVEGQISGQKKTFDQSGAPISVEEWTAGTQHGKTILFENGEKVAEIPYQNGQINGVAKKFRRSSEVIEESSWKNGVQQGPCHTYFDSKKITSWYFNGQKVSKAKYDTLRRA